MKTIRIYSDIAGGDFGYHLSASLEKAQGRYCVNLHNGSDRVYGAHGPIYQGIIASSGDDFLTQFSIWCKSDHYRGGDFGTKYPEETVQAVARLFARANEIDEIIARKLEARRQMQVEAQSADLEPLREQIVDKMARSEEHYRSCHSRGCCWSGQDSGRIHASFNTCVEYKACIGGVVSDDSLEDESRDVALALIRVAAMAKNERQDFWIKCEAAHEEAKKAASKAFAKKQLEKAKSMGFSHRDAVNIMKAAGPGRMLEAIEWAYQVQESDFMPDREALEQAVIDAEAEVERLKKEIDAMSYQDEGYDEKYRELNDSHDTLEAARETQSNAEGAFDALDSLLSGMGGTHGFGEQRSAAVLKFMGLPEIDASSSAAFSRILSGGHAALMAGLPNRNDS